MRLRPLEPCRPPIDGAWTIQLSGDAVEVLDVLVLRARAWAQVEALRLGTRRARETVGPGHALVHALAGAALARVTGEEEPLELEAGDSVWVQGLRGGEELDLAGEEEGTLVLLVRVEPATS
jgi:hypothetical protein